LEVVEGFFQIVVEAATFLGLYHDVININLEVKPHLLFEAKLTHRWFVAPCSLVRMTFLLSKNN
jgi:hypothetical protein